MNYKKIGKFNCQIEKHQEHYSQFYYSTTDCYYVDCSINHFVFFDSLEISLSPSSNLCSLLRTWKTGYLCTRWQDYGFFTTQFGYFPWHSYATHIGKSTNHIFTHMNSSNMCFCQFSILIQWFLLYNLINLFAAILSEFAMNCQCRICSTPSLGFEATHGLNVLRLSLNAWKL